MAGLPLSQQPQQLKTIRERQFGQFSESVEVGLQRYQGKAGVRSLFSYLRSRYGTSPQAKLQLALLFSIISPRNQPSDLIRRALGQADNGMVTAAEILEGGRGYTRAESPEILVSAPAAGGTPAVVRAELRSTGQLVSITVASNGSGYPPGLTPAVYISAPSKVGGRRAQAVAHVEDGSVVSVELTDRGRGYSERDNVEVKIAQPRNEYGVPVFLGVAAEASVALELGVNRLVLEDGGKGYARDQPLTIEIAPPRDTRPPSRGAMAQLKLMYSDLEALPSDGPYSDYYPQDSISADLLRLLPSIVRPVWCADGSFSFPRAAPSALREAFERNGGRRQGLDVNMESYLYALRESSGLRQKLPFAVDRDPTLDHSGRRPWSARCR